MAAQKLFGRFIRAALVGGPLLIAGVVCASPAYADEASYLNNLHNIGNQDMDGGDPALVQTGSKICQQISWDAPPQELQSLALQRSDQDQGPKGLDYALVDLCPRA